MPDSNELGLRRGRLRLSRRFARGTLLSVGLLGCLLAPAWGATPIEYGNLSRPRLLLKPADLPAVQTWLQVPGSDNARLFQLWREAMDSRLLDPEPVGTGYKTNVYLGDIAAMYLLSGQAFYGDHAVKIAMWAARNNKEQGSVNNGLGGCSNLALAYDWCYGRFSPAQRDTIRGCLAHAASENKSSDGQWYWYHFYRFEYSFAIVEDASSYFHHASGQTYTNAQIREWLEDYVEDLQDGYVPCLNQVAPGGYHESYPGRRQVPMLTFVASLLGATSWNPFAEPCIANIGASYRARYRPDGLWLRTPNKYNYAQADPYFLFAFYGSRGHDPLAQNLINRIDNDYPATGSLHNVWTYLFYHDPFAAERDLVTLGPLERDYYDRGQGVFLGRSGWTLGPASQDVSVGFWCGGFFGPYAAEWNRHLGHFVAARGGDCLLIDSGAYMNDLDNHHVPYGKSTLAHNTLSIYRPGMSWGTYNDCHEHPGDLLLPNDGGQQAVARSFALCPACNQHGEGSTPPFYSGYILEDGVEQTDDYVEIRADLSPAYADRASQVLRRWVWIRPDWILVQDGIVLSPGLGDTIRTVLHSVERPALDGTLHTVRGNPSYGGVFTSENTTQATINLEGSSARVFFLGVTGGTGTKVRLIGGTNAGGTFNSGWQQDHDPLFEQAEPSEYYDTYSPGATSYEFWIDGKNYPPAEASCRLRDGAYIDRNSPDVGGKANPAGDWRIEYQTTPAEGIVTLTTLIHLTYTGAPPETIDSEVFPDGSVFVTVPRSTGGDVTLTFTRLVGSDPEPHLRWEEDW